MGPCVAVTSLARLTAVAAVLALLSACGSEKPQASPLMQAFGAVAKTALDKRSAKRGQGKSAANAPMTRADLEKLGTPVLQVAVEARGFAALLSPSDVKGEVVTWSNQKGVTFAQRGGILIQTRGLGPDMMSAQVPTVGQLLTAGGTHKRVYYFLGSDDQTTRRSYDCTVAIAGNETLEILERSYTVTHVTETCARPQGSVTNEYWIDGTTVRRSRELLSGGAGFVDFVKIID